MQLRGVWLTVIFAVGLGVVASPPAHAWSLGRAIANVLDVKGFVESASAPTIHDIHSAGADLIADANKAIASQVDRASSITSALLMRADSIAAAKIDQIDHSLQARILQLKDTGDELIDRSIGEVNAAARERIDQVTRNAAKLLDVVDADVANLLAKVDAILTQRIADLNHVVANAIQDADHAAAARIAQLDEVAGRRLGNIDVIATKQTLSFEAVLLRIATLLVEIIFAAFVLWRLFVEAGTAWRVTAAMVSSRERLWATTKAGLRRFGPQLALAAAGGVLFLYLAERLPSDVEARATREIQQHDLAMANAVAAYDVTAIRYEASQLAILEPARSAEHEAQAQKVALVRDVLERPALLEKASSVRDVVYQITLVEQALPRDPDVLALECYVQWRVGGTRRDEFEAARRCADSLAATPPGAHPLLAPLAKSYLRAFFHDPYVPDADVTADQLQTLHQVLATAGGPDPDSPQFQHVIEFDALVAKLDTESTDAYLDMLDAQADYELAHAARAADREQDALGRRQTHAKAVLAAWQGFDAALAGSPWLVDDPTALAAFTLNDAVLSHALYFLAAPAAAALPPRLVGAPPPAKAADAKARSALAKQRVAMAPIRVAWAKRYAALIGPAAHDIVAFQETQRFADFERDTLAFEVAYVAFVRALRERGDAGEFRRLATDAARAAAALELYRGDAANRAPLATALLQQYRDAGGDGPDAQLAAELAAQYQRRPLHFL